MATVIDAFAVSLGLDVAAFSKGLKEASDTFKKTSEEATSRGKEIEAAGKRAAEFFSQLRTQVLGLFAAFTAGKGLKEFVADITSADAPVSRLARNLGVSTETLSTWGKAVELAGGSANSAANSFQGFFNELQTWRSTGQSGIVQWLRALQAEGGHAIDVNKPLAETFLDIAQNLQEVAKQSGPGRANFLGRQLGLDPDFVNLLVNRTKEYLEQAKQLGVVTKQQGEAAEARRTAWRGLLQDFENVGRIVLTELTPALLSLTKMLDQLGEWAQKYPRLTTAAFLAIAAAVTVLTTAMVVGLASTAVAAVVAGLGSITAAFGAMGAVILATPVGWIIAGLAAIGVAGYELYQHWTDWFGKAGASAPAATTTGRQLTRGDRNNNFGNILDGPFARAHGATGSDGRFAIFPSREIGEKAMADLLSSGGYAGLTLAEIQRRWVGNSDPAYLRSMTAATGLSADSVPDLKNAAVLHSLMAGMSRGEGTHLGGIPLAAFPTVPRLASAVSNTNTRSATVTTNVGTIHVNAPSATDANGIASSIREALARNSLANQGNFGAW